MKPPYPAAIFEFEKVRAPRDVSTSNGRATKAGGHPKTKFLRTVYSAEKSPRTRAYGPFKPRYDTGRQRPAPRWGVEETPLLLAVTKDRHPEDTADELVALRTVLDELALRSDWAPFYNEDASKAYPTDWWWLGGGVMLSVHVESCALLQSDKIFICAYEQLDGPPEQSARPTPTLTQVHVLISTALTQARERLKSSPP